MAKEIERKFLLADDRWRAFVAHQAAMLQGYIAKARDMSVRVRVVGTDAWLNIKSGGPGAVRDEYEYSIPLRDAQEMLARLAASALVEKTRHWVIHDGFEWEIDEFRGANQGLVMAEIELEDESIEFPRPGWLGVEVTHLARYYNVSLSEYPYGAWSPAERKP